MAVPTVNHISIESLNLATFDNHLSRWCSSSSLSNSSSTSRSTSSTGFTDCPAMFKSLTDSMSSDTQTENDTPPESPNEGSYLQTTPVFRARERRITERPCRPDLPAYVSMYAESGDDYDGSDAGYETECEDKQPIRNTKRSTTHRKALNRKVFRRRGEPSCHSLAFGGRTHIMPRVPDIPSAPRIGASARIAGQCDSTPSRRGSICRPGGPNAIVLPETAPPVFPGTSAKATIGLGLGLGLPSTLSSVQSAPNCAHRSNTDAIPSPTRSRVPVTHADLLLPLDLNPPPPTPLKPRLNPMSLSPSGELSPLDLDSSPTLGEVLHPLTNVTTSTTSSADLRRPRQAAFCFSHGVGLPTDFLSSTYGTTAAAFLTMANHAQSQDVQVTCSRKRNPKGPPSRGSLLLPMQEEVCPGDEARGIRRFAAMNPYFATMGYCVTSG